MPYVTVGTDMEIYYEDHGAGQPVVLIHGTAGRILPCDATARRLPGLIEDLRLVPVEGGPHNICWTRSDEVTAVLLDFLAR